jgi:hypothetical protein
MTNNVGKSFSTLWCGSKLSKLEILSLRSFAYHGYEIDLYAYDESMNVPDGVNLRDASEIMPEDSQFEVRGSLAIFSDVFRYNLIAKKNTIWVDADCICLGASLPTSDEYLFVYNVYGDNHTLCNGFLTFPQNSLLEQRLLLATHGVDFVKMYHDNPSTPWGISGPQLITRLVDELGLRSYSRPYWTINPFSFRDVAAFFDSSKLPYFIRNVERSHIAHCSNVFITLRDEGKGLDKNFFPENSALWHLYESYTKPKSSRLFINAGMFNDSSNFEKWCTDRGLRTLSSIGLSNATFDDWFTFERALNFIDAVDSVYASRFFSEMQINYKDSVYLK